MMRRRGLDAQNAEKPVGWKTETTGMETCTTPP